MSRVAAHSPIWILLLLVLLSWPALAADRDEPEPLVIGETFTMDSDIMSEQRRINVFAPAAYAASPEERFPVLYMPDGGIGEDFLHIAGLVQVLSLNGGMRPFLLVGIENTERRRDMSGPTSTESDRRIAPEVGGSAKFRAFLRDELMPVIDAAYRTTDERAIVGESAAGLFVVETLLLEPQLFDHYLAVDPSLWWDSGRLVDRAVALLNEHADLRASLFLATGPEAGNVQSTERLATRLAEGVPQLELEVVRFPGETHRSIFHPAALQGFRRMLGSRAGDSTGGR